MIRPIEMQMLLPRTESVGTMQQNENQHIMNTNLNAASEVQKHEQELSQTVVEKEDKQFDTYRYDASEEGNNQYKGKRRKNKSNSSKESSLEQDEDSSMEVEEAKEFQPRINFNI